MWSWGLCDDQQVWYFQVDQSSSVLLCKLHHEKRMGQVILWQFRNRPSDSPEDASQCILAMLRGFPMTHTISERTTMSQGMPITVTTVNGMDRIEINNKLHEIGDQLLKLKMEQQYYVEMRNQIDRQNEMREMDDLFDDIFGGWIMKVELNDYQINLITYCLQMEKHEFTPQEKSTYQGILQAIESAANFEYDFGY